MAPPGWSPRPGSPGRSTSSATASLCPSSQELHPLTAHTHRLAAAGPPPLPGGRPRRPLSLGAGLGSQSRPQGPLAGGAPPAGAETSCPCLAPAAPLVRSHGWLTPAVARGPVTFTPASPGRAAPCPLSSPPPPPWSRSPRARRTGSSTAPPGDSSPRAAGGRGRASGRGRCRRRGLAAGRGGAGRAWGGRVSLSLWAGEGALPPREKG